MLQNIKILCHSCIRIEDKYVIYFDPFKVNKNYNDADIIFITHSHYDHYSKEDINKIRKKDTIFIAPIDLLNTLLNNDIIKENIITVVPNEKYTVSGINFKTIPAYNTNKQFHPKENNWVGYLIKLNNITYYIAGDTDITKENKKIKCDIAFVPVGGTYTMDYKEAADLINIIKPQIAIPTHYGSIVGNINDGLNFSKLLNNDIKYKILT